MSDDIGSRRIETLAEMVRAQNRTLAMMLGTQKLHNEMLAKVLEAVTREADDDDESSLTKLLQELVAAGRDHTEKLDLIFRRVYDLE